MLAPGTFNGDCNNPVIADAQGNLAYIKACYPNTPLAEYLASQSPGAPLTLNPPPSVLTSMPTVIGTPASLSSLPWYYYAGGAAVLLFLFRK